MCYVEIMRDNSVEFQLLFWKILVVVDKKKIF